MTFNKPPSPTKKKNAFCVLCFTKTCYKDYEKRYSYEVDILSN